MLKEKFVIGMDGGGTATKVVIAHVDGSVINQFQIGSLNINGQTRQMTENTLTEALEKVLESGLELKNCIGICIGAAGISNSDTKDIITKTLRYKGLECNINIVGDHETALAGALDGTCGVILIAGTGSICFGVTKEGECIRSGGYGHLIDDAGSAYAIGRDILKAVVREEDGRGTSTILTQKVFEQLAIRNTKELVTWIYDKDRSKKEIASLAVLLEQGTLAGDKISNEILKNNVMELVDLAKAVLVHFIQVPELVVSGSVLMKNKEIFTLFSQIIRTEYPTISIVKMRGSAAEGAVKIALKESTHGKVFSG